MQLSKVFLLKLCIPSHLVDDFLAFFQSLVTKPHKDFNKSFLHASSHGNLIKTALNSTF